MEKTPSNQVHVKNISAEASEKTITDFFGFCGKITSITLLERAQEVPVKEAIIEFQEVNAAKTAILLSNAMIVDRAITVSYYDPQAVQESTEKGEEQPKVTSVKTENEIENRPHIVPASERSNTSVVASLLAAGYTLGTDALQKARDYDEQHMITSTIKGQAEALKEKVTELDTSLGISATASSWASSASSFFGGLGISEKAAAFRQSSSNLLQSVGESEVVTTTAATLSGMKEAVVEVAGTIKEEASKFMEEPAIKVVSEKLTEGKEVVKGVAEEVEKGVMSVAGETSRLISENLTKPTNPDDEALLVVLEEEEGGVASKPEAEQINPPDEAKKN